MKRFARYLAIVVALMAVVLAGMADFPIPGFPWH
jgi:hypothetical protein